MQKNLFGEVVKKHDDMFDDLVFGKGEDRWQRYQRRREFKKTYGHSPWIVAWMPGIFAYKGIKETLKDKTITAPERLIRCSIDLGAELILDAARLAAVYGAYRFYDYLCP